MKSIAITAFAIVALASLTIHAQELRTVEQKNSLERYMAALADPGLRKAMPATTRPIATNCTSNSDCTPNCCCKVGSSKACEDRKTCDDAGGSC
jgi:hypothetical protein